jgi:hypothetical protein
MEEVFYTANGSNGFLRKYGAHQLNHTASYCRSPKTDTARKDLLRAVFFILLYMTNIFIR